MSPLRFIYLYPATHDQNADMIEAGPVPEVAAAAEAAGFHAFGLTEHPAPDVEWFTTTGHQTLDPFVGLGAAAAATRRIRLITYLSVATYRNPLLLAKTAATVDLLSGGRLILGLGSGYLAPEFEALGVTMAERNALFEEALDVLPMHWSGEPFSYQGRHFTARDIVARPRPVQQPIPVWIGGNGRRTRERVAHRAHGWMPMLVDPGYAARTRTTRIGSLAELNGLIREVKDLAEAAGRNEPISVSHAYRDLSVCTPLVEVDRHLEAFAEIGAAGVTDVAVSCFTTSRAETLDFLEGFGATYCRAKP